ncbi:hypothetical protein CJP74_01615 [Psittacicella melopsittaci]|uniref:HTH lysR-type domain-containing protein n=1 Tax=Psittacicella melopsittaci TaxID=2028576 RepID=A0A3A1Y8N9_9GAMM|nr:substrate binding domain-containing protein [Psittacicella melopsittaci]RIY33590.1 hypothetical protein CJP74_01615 [Psittacicella melopsittaci]
MDRIEAMKVFLQVAHTGSFTDAAQGLDISTAKVSRYISFLEDWLKVRLFNRTTRNVSLTSAGEQLVQQCQQILELVDKMQELKDEPNHLSGTIRITTSVSFAIAQLNNLLAQFQKLHPQVNIHLLVADSNTDLINDRIDLAIRFGNTIEDSLIARQISTCESKLVTTEKYIKSLGFTPTTPEELERLNFITYAQFDKKDLLISKGEITKLVKMQGSFVSNDVTNMFLAVQNGLGVAMLPNYLIESELNKGKFIELLPDWELPTIGIHIVYTSRQYMPANVRALIDFLVKEAPKYKW